MRVVGLTGGIGSGKSTVARLLAAWGAVVVDADAVAREVVAPGEPALPEIVEAFGAEVLSADGGLDRPAMARLVFDDPDARGRLEAITHPRIAARIAARVRATAAAESADGRPRVVVVDHPLLVESGAVTDFETVVVVTAPEHVRVRRLVEQRGMDVDDARARIRTQADDATRLSAATHVIDNDGSFDDLRGQVEALAEELGLLAAA